MAGHSHGPRADLVIATKAGDGMRPGTYGNSGSRTYLLASLDQSLRRVGPDHVGFFYSHCRDPDTPLEETVGAHARGRRQSLAQVALAWALRDRRMRPSARGQRGQQITLKP